MNLRKKIILYLTIATLILIGIYLYGLYMPESFYEVNFADRDLSPNFNHLFGCDWLGRDMLNRSIKGLSVSIKIGLVASFVSAVIAIIVGVCAATMGKYVDGFILWLIDLVQGIPHLILLIFISIMVGKGVKGVLIGVAATHWTSLARIIRAEILSIKNEPYIKISQQLGKGKIYIAVKHILVKIIPQIIIGIVLLFPHAILHESSITFLGFGIPSEMPAIGVILSESMRYITQGNWWLSVLPGALLLGIVLLFDTIGSNLRKLIDPKSAQL